MRWAGSGDVGGPVQSSRLRGWTSSTSATGLRGVCAVGRPKPTRMIIWNFRWGPHGSCTRSRSSGYSSAAFRKDAARSWAVGYQQKSFEGLAGGQPVGWCVGDRREHGDRRMAFGLLLWSGRIVLGRTEVPAGKRPEMCSGAECGGRDAVAPGPRRITDPQRPFGESIRVVGVIAGCFLGKVFEPVPRDGSSSQSRHAASATTLFVSSAVTPSGSDALRNGARFVQRMEIAGYSLANGRPARWQGQLGRHASVR